jgi:hypothetical protein
MSGALDSDLATEVVADQSRMSAAALTLAWWSIVSAMFYGFVAATLARAYGTTNALLGMAAAIVFYSIAGGILARYAIRTGLGSFLLSQALFGRAGAAIATLILFVTAIYYAVFEGAVVASAAVKILPGVSHAAACVVIVCYSVPLIAGSVQRWLNRFNGALLPIYLAGLAASVLLALHRYGYSDQWLELGGAGRHIDHHWWDCFVAYLGVSVMFMFAQDYARFGLLQDERYHARFNFGYLFYGTAFALNGVIGVFLIGTTQLANLTEASLVDAFVAVLGGPLALLFVWVSQTRINTANYYVATVNMQAFFQSLLPVRMPKLFWAIAVGMVVLILMLAAKVLQYIPVALAYQGAFVAAWVGVALSHVLSHPFMAPAIDSSSCSHPRVKLAGVIAWIAGAGSSMILMQMAPPYNSLATPAALLVSGILYAFICALTPQGVQVSE